MKLFPAVFYTSDILQSIRAVRAPFHVAALICTILLSASSPLQGQPAPAEESVTEAKAAPSPTSQEAVASETPSPAPATPKEAPPQPSAEGTPAPEGAAVIVEVKGPINGAVLSVLRRAIKDAEKEGKKGLILDMDTPGGELNATQKISEALGKTSLTTATFVNTTAYSAGALIALSTDKIFMAPVAAIGAAAVVMGGGEDVPETMNDKVTSGYSAYFRSVAESHGHNPEIATAFMDKTKEVKIGDVIVNPSGKLLSFSTGEATRVIEGKPVLALGVAENAEEVARLAGFKESVVFQPSGFENASLWLTAISPLLLTIGLIAGYIEFKTPGFGIPGIIAGIAFTLFFASHYIAGLAGLELIFVFFLGFIMVLIEVIFFPGVVLPALTGVLLMVGALLYAMADHYPSQPTIPISLEGWEQLILPGATTLTVSAFIAGIGILLIGKLFPSTPGVRRLVLKQAVSERGASAVAVSTGLQLVPGMEGVTSTPLMPGGKVVVSGIPADAIAESGFIAKGRPVKVLRVSGASIVVAETTPDAASQ